MALGGLCPLRPVSPLMGTGPRPPTGGQPRTHSGERTAAAGAELGMRSCGTNSQARSCARPGSALALLVTRIRADDHDPAVAPDNPALVTDLLNARLDLHPY